jgi:hypothetical protein
MQELIPLGCGLLLGAAIGFVRPSIRLPVGATSTAGPTIHPDRDGWVAAGYTLQGGQSRQNILPRVVHYELT